MKPTVLRRKFVRSVSVAAVRSRSRYVSSPAVGTSSPPRLLSRVVLPLPEGPNSTTNSPGYSSKSTPAKALTSAGPEPYTLVRPRTRYIGVRSRAAGGLAMTGVTLGIKGDGLPGRHSGGSKPGASLQYDDLIEHEDLFPLTQPSP